MHMVLRSLLVPLGLVLLLSLSDCVNFASWATDTATDQLSPEEDEVDDQNEDEMSEAPTRRLTPHPTATPKPTSTSRPTITVLPTSTPEPGFTEEDLESLLIGLDDLPPNWTLATVSDPPTEVPGIDDTNAMLASAFFQRSELGPYLVHMLLYTENEATARTAYRAIEEEIDSGGILDDVTDQVRSWETQPARFTEFGDETFAFTAIGDTGLIPVAADIVTTRQGTFVSFIIHAELLEVDTDLTEDLVETAVDSLPTE